MILAIPKLRSQVGKAFKPKPLWSMLATAHLKADLLLTSPSHIDHCDNKRGNPEYLHMPSTMSNIYLTPAHSETHWRN